MNEANDIQTTEDPARCAAPHGSGQMPDRVHDQIIAMAEKRNVPTWVNSDSWLPPDPEPVLATDQGTHYVASWDGKDWIDVHSDEAIDCHITHWMWLPNMPDE